MCKTIFQKYIVGFLRHFKYDDRSTTEIAIIHHYLYWLHNILHVYNRHYHHSNDQNETQRNSLSSPVQFYVNCFFSLRFHFSMIFLKTCRGSNSNIQDSWTILIYFLSCCNQELSSQLEEQNSIHALLTAQMKKLGVSLVMSH
jgi:hypothetical protein